MPGYKGHLAGGTVCFFLMLFGVTHWLAPSWLRVIEWLLFTLAGSLFPDIDIKSKGQKLFYSLLFILFVLLIFNRCFTVVALLSVASFLPLLVNHRGLFHRAWFVVAVPFCVAFIVSLCLPGSRAMLLVNAAFFAAGALSHLWLDMGIARMMRW